MFRNMFQVLSNELLTKNAFGYCLKGRLFVFNNGHFPSGVQEEEIQQWRQAWSRPREKETINIMLREEIAQIIFHMYFGLPGSLQTSFEPKH